MGTVLNSHNPEVIFKIISYIKLSDILSKQVQYSLLGLVRLCHEALTDLSDYLRIRVILHFPFPTFVIYSSGIIHLFPSFFAPDISPLWHIRLTILRVIPSFSAVFADVM